MARIASSLTLSPSVLPQGGSRYSTGGIGLNAHQESQSSHYTSSSGSNSNTSNNYGLIYAEQNRELAKRNAMYITKIQELQSKQVELESENSLLKRKITQMTNNKSIPDEKLRTIESKYIFGIREMINAFTKLRSDQGLPENEELSSIADMLCRPITSTPIEVGRSSFPAFNLSASPEPQAVSYFTPVRSINDSEDDFLGDSFDERDEKQENKVSTILEERELTIEGKELHNDLLIDMNKPWTPPTPSALTPSPPAKSAVTPTTTALVVVTLKVNPKKMKTEQNNVPPSQQNENIGVTKPSKTNISEANDRKGQEQTKGKLPGKEDIEHQNIKKEKAVGSTSKKSKKSRSKKAPDEKRKETATSNESLNRKQEIEKLTPNEEEHQKKEVMEDSSSSHGIRRSGRARKEIDYKPIPLGVKLRRQSIGLLDAVGENMYNYAISRSSTCSQKRKSESPELERSTKRKPLSNVTNANNHHQQGKGDRITDRKPAKITSKPKITDSSSNIADQENVFDFDIQESNQKHSYNRKNRSSTISIT